LCTRYRKVVEEYKDIENDFYSNNSLNDALRAMAHTAMEFGTEERE